MIAAFGSKSDEEHEQQLSVKHDDEVVSSLKNPFVSTSHG